MQQKRPNTEQIDKLALLLNFHPSIFYVSRPARLAKLSEFYHRAFVKAKRMDVKAVHARCGIIDLQVDSLLALCPPLEDLIPDIDPDNHAGDVEKIAAMSRARMRIPPGQWRISSTLSKHAAGLSMGAGSAEAFLPERCSAG